MELKDVFSRAVKDAFSEMNNNCVDGTKSRRRKMIKQIAYSKELDKHIAVRRFKSKSGSNGKA